MPPPAAPHPHPQGLTTIRALRKQQRFVQHTHALMDNSARAWWPCQCVNRWLSVRLELVGLVVVFGSALFVSVVQRRSAGLAGLAITSALNLTGLMNWCVLVCSDVIVKHTCWLVLFVCSLYITNFRPFLFQCTVFLFSCLHFICDKHPAPLLADHQPMSHQPYLLITSHTGWCARSASWRWT